MLPHTIPIGVLLDRREAGWSKFNEMCKDRRFEKHIAMLNKKI
jgi:hypothetical protein